jgi:hypothetical protein
VSLLLQALRAVTATLAVEESRVYSPVPVKFSVWHWFTMFDAKVCDDCDYYKGDEYELVDPNDLLLMFPYGYFEDEYTFRPIVHPNDRCKIERVRDYDWMNKLIQHVKGDVA